MRRRGGKWPGHREKDGEDKDRKREQKEWKRNEKGKTTRSKRKKEDRKIKTLSKEKDRNPKTEKIGGKGTRRGEGGGGGQLWFRVSLSTSLFFSKKGKPRNSQSSQFFISSWIFSQLEPRDLRFMFSLGGCFCLCQRALRFGYAHSPPPLQGSLFKVSFWAPNFQTENPGASGEW